MNTEMPIGQGQAQDTIDMHRSPKKNTRHSMTAAALVALTLGASPALAQSQTERARTEYDFDAINRNIAVATDTVVENSSVLKSAVVTVDGDVTDLENDVYKVNKKMVLKHSPWSNGRMKIDLAITAAMQREEDPEKGSLALDAVAKVKTDTLAMVKFLNAKKLKRCAERVETGFKRISQKHACGLAEDVAKARSLKAVAKSIAEHLEGEKVDLKKFITRAESSVARESNERMQAEGVKLVAKAKRKLHALDSIKVATQEGGFQMSLEHLNTSYPDLKIKTLTVSLTPDSAEISAAGSLRLSTMFYDAFKPEIAHIFRGLEDGREYAIEHISAHARLRDRVLTAMVKHRSTESAAQQAQQQLPVAVVDDATILGSVQSLQSIGFQLAQP